MSIGVFAIKKIKIDPDADAEFRFTNVEKIFGILMVFTACGMAFAHGSNDVANAVGPVAAVISIIDTGEVTQKSALPIYVLLIGGVGIVVGLATFGYRVISTVGTKITELTPSRGFAAELAAATTVVIASGTGIPISTTHTLVGAVLGVGLARGISALNLGVIRTIFMSWIITLPAGAVLAMIVANSGWYDAYHHILTDNMGPIFSPELTSKLGPMSLHLWINDGLMAVFFFLVGLELKREVLEGELSKPANVLLPVLGAIGGIVVPVAIFVWFNAGDARRCVAGRFPLRRI